MLLQSLSNVAFSTQKFRTLEEMLTSMATNKPTADSLQSLEPNVKIVIDDVTTTSNSKTTSTNASKTDTSSKSTPATIESKIRILY